ncbi:MAG: GerMN domain-containing protein [Candidatus Eremiobacteraeota bacterium]|nr:GerMN domain-containing protein [Candidatus Eremiobacteraeota bacterium]
MKRTDFGKMTRPLVFLMLVFSMALFAALQGTQGCTSKTGLDSSALQHSFPPSGGPSQASPTPPKASPALQDPHSAKVFYANSVKDPEVLNPEITYPIEIGLAADKDEEAVKKLIDELIKGPADQFKKQGYYTTLPPHTKLNSVKIEQGMIQVDFNDRINEGGGSCEMDQRRSQIENTLKNLPGNPVKKVVISVNGDTQNVLQP